MAGRPACRMGLWGERSAKTRGGGEQMKESQLDQAQRREEATLTHYIQLVGVVDAAVLVLHHAGVVAFVGGHHGLHDDGPHVLTDLKVQTRR